MGVQVKLSAKVRNPLTNQVSVRELFLGPYKFEDGVGAVGFCFKLHTFSDRETAYRAVIDYFDRTDTLDGITAFLAGMGEKLGDHRLTIFRGMVKDKVCPPIPC